MAIESIVDGNQKSGINSPVEEGWWLKSYLQGLCTIPGG